MVLTVAKPILTARSRIVAPISMVLELLPLLSARLSLNARLWTKSLFMQVYLVFLVC